MFPRAPLWLSTGQFRTVVLEQKVPGYLGVGPTNHRHRQLGARRHVRHRLSLASETSAQREALSASGFGGLLENGVGVAGPSVGPAGFGRERMREVNQCDVEALSRQPLQAPRGHVRAAPCF